MSDLILHSGQQQALEQILEITKSPGEVATLIPLTGLSGVGKDTLWRSVRTKVKKKRFIDIDHLLDSPQHHNSKPGFVFTTSTLEEVGRLNWDRDIFPVIVKGMNVVEIADYLAKFEDQFGSYTQNQLIEHSLGIPLLAQIIMQNQNLSSRELALVTGSHLRHCLDHRSINLLLEKPENWVDYLSVPVSSSIREAFENAGRDEYSNKYGQTDLPDLLEKRAELQKTWRITLEKPFFICPASSIVYATMWKTSSFYSDLDLFAPNLSPAEIQKIQAELFASPGQDKGFRYQMMGSPTRKIALALADEKDLLQWYFGERVSPEDIKSYQQAHQEGGFPLSVDSQNKGSFYFHAHEHAKLKYLQLALGMATENLLQNLGISYVVDYRIIEKAFCYDSTTNTLNEIDQFSKKLRGEQADPETGF